MGLEVNKTMSSNQISNVRANSSIKPTHSSSAADGMKTLHDKQLQADFEKALEASKLDERKPTSASLAKMGFKKEHCYINGEEAINMGEETYSNDNGDKITLRFPNEVTYESNDGSISHTIIYDPDGNPLKGTIVTKEKDDSMVQYEYEYDLDGNAQLIPSKTLYTLGN